MIYVEKHHNWNGKHTGIDDMNKLLDVIRAKDEMPTAPDILVGVFGITGGDGYSHIMAWKVSGVRKDRRHGFVDEVEPPCRHTKELLESMFKGWN